MIPRGVRLTCYFCLVLWCGAAPALSAQSNQLIDDLLAEEQATFGKSIHLVLQAAGVIDEQSAVIEAIDALADKHWNVELKPAWEPIQLGEYAYILMRAFHIQGGIMYSIFPGPRYASKELAFMGIIPEKESPGRTVSGEEVLRILGRILEVQEERS